MLRTNTTLKTLDVSCIQFYLDDSQKGNSIGQWGGEAIYAAIAQQSLAIVACRQRLDPKRIC